jgi:hypothetical protein
MSPVALKQYLIMAGREPARSSGKGSEDAGTRSRNGAGGGGASSNTSSTSPGRRGGGDVDDSRPSTAPVRVVFESTTRPWDADGPMRVLSDADLAVTRRCKVSE